MKKFLALVLSIALLFSMHTFVFAQSQNSSKTATNTYSGKVNLNLLPDGKKMLSKLSSANLKVDSFIISENNITLDGIVSYNGNEYPININGGLFKAETFDQTLIGDTTDNSNNFDVLSLSLIKSATKDRLYVNTSLVKKETLQLFLIKKGTKECIMFEIAIPDLIANSDSANVSYDYQNAPKLVDMSKEHWWTKTFQPEETLNPALVQPSVAGYTDTKTFTYYNGPGNCYKYVITLRANSDIFNEPDFQNPGFDYFTFTVVSQQYYYNNRQYSGNFLYVHHCLATVVLTSSNSTVNKDRLVNAHWGWRYTQSTGGWNFTPSVSASFGTFISGTISWTPRQDVVITSGDKNFGGEDVQGFKLPYDPMLCAAGDYYTMNIVKQKVTTSTAKLSGCTFSYQIGFSSADNFYSGSLTTCANYQ